MYMRLNISNKNYSKNWCRLNNQGIQDLSFKWDCTYFVLDNNHQDKAKNNQRIYFSQKLIRGPMKGYFMMKD